MIEARMLEDRPGAPVLLVGSRECALAAQPHLRAYVIFGYDERDDLALLAQRKVDLWPDATPHSKKRFDKAAAELLLLQCPQVRKVTPNGSLPGWNIAAAVEEGWGSKRLLEFARAHLHPVRRPQRVLARTPRRPPAMLPSSAPEPATEPVAELPGPGLTNVREWGLQCSSAGKPHSNHLNVFAVLQHSRRTIWFESFSNKIKFYDEAGEERTWSELHDARFARWMQEHALMVDVKPRVVRDAVRDYADLNRRNEAQEWLEMLRLGQPWDGENRLEHLMSSGFGAPRNLYTAAVGRCFLTSVIARILEPGCKVDTMPVLEGGQGIGKSQALELLGGKWYKLADAKHLDKDFYIGLLGRSIVEVAEMTVTRKNDVENVKSMITCRVDNFREPYGRDALDHPRTCVFVGTTNSQDWNADDTGARRFLPIGCTRIDLGWIREHKLQLYAEALQRYRAFKAGNLEDAWWNFPVDAAEAEQLARRPDDPWDEEIRRLVAARNHVFTADLMGMLLIERKDHSLPTHYRIGSILKRFGFRNSTKRHPDGTVQRCYLRINAIQADQES